MTTLGGSGCRLRRNVPLAFGEDTCTATRRRERLDRNVVPLDSDPAVDGTGILAESDLGGRTRCPRPRRSAASPRGWPLYLGSAREIRLWPTSSTSRASCTSPLPSTSSRPSSSTWCAPGRLRGGLRDGLRGRRRALRDELQRPRRRRRQRRPGPALHAHAARRPARLRRVGEPRAEARDRSQRRDLQRLPQPALRRRRGARRRRTCTAIRCTRRDLSRFIQRNTPHVFAPGAVQRAGRGDDRGAAAASATAAGRDACATGRSVTRALDGEGRLLRLDHGAAAARHAVRAASTPRASSAWTPTSSCGRSSGRAASRRCATSTATPRTTSSACSRSSWSARASTATATRWPTSSAIGDQTALAIYLAAQPRPTTRVELARLGLIPALTAEESAAIRNGAHDVRRGRLRRLPHAAHAARGPDLPRAEPASGLPRRASSRAARIRVALERRSGSWPCAST